MFDYLLKTFTPEEAATFFDGYETDFFGFKNASYVQEGVFLHTYTDEELKSVGFPADLDYDVVDAFSFSYDYGRGKFKLYDRESREIRDWTLKKTAINTILNGDVYPDYSCLFDRYPVPEDKEMPTAEPGTKILKAAGGLGMLTFTAGKNGKLWLNAAYESSYGTIRRLPKWLMRDPDFRLAMANVKTFREVKVQE